jgi:hypothetical protein
MSESTGNIAIPLPYDYAQSNPMSHEEAVEVNAVELYVLKDLTPEQELRFEEHYFECQECANAVSIEQSLLANAAYEEARQPWWRRWAFPVLTPVTTILLALVGYQSFELQQLSYPLPNTIIVAQAAMKGGTEDSKLIGTPSITIEINLPPDESPSHFYRVILLGEGRQPLSQVLPGPEGSRLSMQVLSRSLGTGAYNVLVYGLASQDAKDGPKIGQYYFNIQLR